MTVSRLDRLCDQRLYLIAGQPGPVADWLEPTTEAVAAGVGLVQVRLKGATTNERRAALALARSRLGPDVLLIVNDDIEAVWNENGAPLADGVHLGRDDATALADSNRTPTSDLSAGLAAARRRLGPDLLLGTSTRSLAEVDRAVAAGADHVGFGALAASSTKPDTVTADPAELARCLAAHPELPLFPIGGLAPATLDRVLCVGCRRAAVGSAILGARDVTHVVESLLLRLA